MENVIFETIGAIGLLLISVGLLARDRRRLYELDILGGILLEIYSVYIGDAIFITLQIVFTLAAIYGLVKAGRKRTKAR